MCAIIQKNFPAEEHIMDLYKNEAFWSQVREKSCFEGYREELCALWEKYCAENDIPVMNYTEFKLFWTTGDRNVYQAKYFARRHALACSALLSLIYADEEKYINKLMDVIYAICDEYTWCLPAHYGSLDSLDYTHIDLFAAETGFALSEILTLLRDRLEPIITHRIEREIDLRIIKPFCASTKYSHWERNTDNWTAVCTGSVACTMMLMRPDLADDAMIERFNTSMNVYLTGLADDGVCLEGCSYWHYGFGFFTVYADMVREFTCGKVDYFKNEKVKRVATFIQKATLGGGCGISFADSFSKYSYHIGLVHRLKHEYPDDIVIEDPRYAIYAIDSARFCLHLRSLLWYREEYLDAGENGSKLVEYYAPSAQWMIKRTESYGFAAKGGCNSEPHNHNDVGSFIFAKNGNQIITDLGSGLYTRQYFERDIRYTIIEPSSRSHSVPVIDGKHQIFGGGARAEDVKFENGTFSMNIANAYNLDCLDRIDRSFTLADDRVILTDKFVYSGEGEIIDRLTSTIKPQLVSDGKIELGDAIITYDPTTCDCTVISEPTTRNPDVLCYMIDFKLKNGIKEFTCEIK